MSSFVKKINPDTIQPHESTCQGKCIGSPLTLKSRPTPSQIGKFQNVLSKDKKKTVQFYKSTDQDDNTVDCSDSESYDKPSLFGLIHAQNKQKSSSLIEETSVTPLKDILDTTQEMLYECSLPIEFDSQSRPDADIIEEICFVSDDLQEVTIIDVESGKLPPASLEKMKNENEEVQRMQGVVALHAPAPQLQPHTFQNVLMTAEAHHIDLQRLVEFIGTHLLTMRSKNLQEMVFDIHYPPLFAGARLIVQEYQQAKGEFNLVFENLSQPARIMIESQVHQDRLGAALSKKGYKLQKVTIGASSKLGSSSTQRQARTQQDEEMDLGLCS